jgi:hypothetical protein
MPSEVRWEWEERDYPILWLYQTEADGETSAWAIQSELSSTSPLHVSMYLGGDPEHDFGGTVGKEGDRWVVLDFAHTPVSEVLTP